MSWESLLTNPFLAIFALLGLGVLAVAYGTIAQNAWGVNLGQTFCPCCNGALSRIRKPQSGRQSLWGGCTCPSCGTEVDKWGREIHVRAGWWGKFYDGPRSIRVFRLAFIGVLLTLEIWYDVHYREFSFFDSAVILALLVWAAQRTKAA